MKKLLLFALLIVLSLTACSDKDAKDASSEKTSTSDVKTKDDYTDSFIGYTINTSYQNFNLGIACDFPEDWVVYTKDEILEINDLDKVPSVDEIVPGFKYTDLVAYSTRNYDSVIISFVKDEDSVSDTSDMAETKLSVVKGDLEMLGYTDISAEVSTIEFLGEECDCVNVSALLEEDSVSKTYVYKMIDDIMVTFEVEAYEEASITDILSTFTINE